MGPAGIRVDDRVELPQKGLIFLSLECLDLSSFTALFIQESLPRLLLKAPGFRMDEVCESQYLALQDEEAENVLFTERCLGLETDACGAAARSVDSFEA
mgnify:FL=1